MKAFELIAEVDEQGHLQAVLPEDAPPGPVRVIVLLPEELPGETNGSPAAADIADTVDTDDAAAQARAEDWEQLRQLIRECAVHTGIGDLAHQHDHYLYGTPKRTE
ncbi:MAG: hypothetical protein M3347_08595 [Armatimonadota bacterium]|nr:hypothetical protein [Armatimonadota bacterium]